VLTFTSTLNDGRGILPAATMLCGERDLERCIVGGDVLYEEALRGSFGFQDMACWCWLYSVVYTVEVWQSKKPIPHESWSRHVRGVLVIGNH
jgi:hypothetical protein